MYSLQANKQTNRTCEPVLSCMSASLLFPCTLYPSSIDWRPFGKLKIFLGNSNISLRALSGFCTCQLVSWRIFLLPENLLSTYPQEISLCWMRARTAAPRVPSPVSVRTSENYSLRALGGCCSFLTTGADRDAMYFNDKLMSE